MKLNQYFQSYQEYFWQWETDTDFADKSEFTENNLITIPNVGTISYFPYIIEVLKALQPQGLPPFGSLLLVIYATQEGPLNLDGIFYYLNRLKSRKEISELIEPALCFLEMLSTLNNNLKKKQNKVILLQTVFKNCHNAISAKKAEILIEQYNQNPKVTLECSKKIILTDSVLNKDIGTLSLLHKKYPNATTLINDIKGWNKEPEVEFTEPIISSKSDTDFIQELIKNQETFEVGSLIKRIQSGIKIPMYHPLLGEYPTGDIADISNKGEMHRIILSEFANENEMFISRIANNEVLYIEREIPPEENNPQRILLLDVSLKNWGTPKILGFATAIAIIKHPKSTIHSSAVILNNNSISTAFENITDVIQGLNEVSPLLESSASLKKYFKNEYKKDQEIIFVTCQESIENTELQNTIYSNRDKIKYLITTSFSGELNIFKHYKNSRKHLQKIIFPLQELWEPSHISNIKNNESVELPSDYPILLPLPDNWINTFYLDGLYYALTSKRQLVIIDHVTKNIFSGYKTLYSQISIKLKGDFELVKNLNGEHVLYQFQNKKALLSKINLDTKIYSELDLSNNKWFTPDIHLMCLNGQLYLHDERFTVVYNLSIEGNLKINKVNECRKIEKEYNNGENQYIGPNIPGVKLVTNISTIGITNKEKLTINKFELNLTDTNFLSLNYRTKDPLISKAQQFHNTYTFADGSSIVHDKYGILIFKSMDINIPQFYIPCVLFKDLAIATDLTFSGNKYYLPEIHQLEVINIKKMYSEYIQTFIKHIIQYDAAS
ncbi:hypothetical protein O2K51_04235 [Apibacter raozihei]|uniref:hypothetical protein n=1 Tax=Apibacter raozihei TaxID=2500547 RepID=UPI000FE2D89D|nr:hypothetical protein [Apibacter raozihei]